MHDFADIRKQITTSKILVEERKPAESQDIERTELILPKDGESIDQYKGAEMPKIFVKCSNTKDKKRAWDKRHYCLYCCKPYLKIVRHLESCHKGEEEVERLILLQYRKDDSADTKMIKQQSRKNIIDSLRSKGNFNHNTMVLNQGYGELIVKRCPPSVTMYTEYLPCEHCLEFYYRHDLHRHVKICSQGKGDTSTKCCRVQANASMLLPNSKSSISEDLMKIFKRMKVDDVSTALKVDDTIIKFGNILCRKHSNNDDQTYYISNKLRELGRLLLAMRSFPSINSFVDIINPKFFPDVIACVSKLCGWDEQTKTIDTPSLGIKLGQLLTKVAYLIKGEAIISEDENTRTKADDFATLVAMRWNNEISRVSRTELEVRKWNTPQILPLTEDLKVLKNHLSSTRNVSINELAKDNNDLKAWRNLCSTTLASLILLNRRREGETSKLEVNCLQQFRHGNVENEEIKKSLSNFELQLCKYFKRLEIRGKRGRKVPLLITKELESAIHLLVKLRESVGVNSNNKFVFAIPTMNSLQYMRGHDAIRKHVKLSSLKCPEAVSSTKLRKHIATLSQLINLEERELEMLAGFLGHDIKVHRDFYRLPEDTLQIAKCGKLLMLMDKGNVGDFAGKSLDEIDLDMSSKTYSFD